jgi:hypothetical protein
MTGKNSPQWRKLLDVAETALDLSDYQMAEEVLLKAYELAVKQCGPDSGAPGLVLLRLAEVSFKTGRNELGKSYQNEVQRIVEIYMADG